MPEHGNMVMHRPGECTRNILLVRVDIGPMSDNIAGAAYLSAPGDRLVARTPRPQDCRGYSRNSVYYGGGNLVLVRPLSSSAPRRCATRGGQRAVRASLRSGRRLPRGCMTSPHRPTSISRGSDGSWERVVGKWLRHHPRARDRRPRPASRARTVSGGTALTVVLAWTSVSMDAGGEAPRRIEGSGSSACGMSESISDRTVTSWRR